MICWTRAASSVPGAKYGATRDTQKAADSATLDTHGYTGPAAGDETLAWAGVVR
jgi:hypothetical protein